MAKIPYGPLAPDTSDLIGACQAVLAHPDLSERRKLDCLGRLAAIPDATETFRQAMSAWIVAAELGHKIPSSYGAEVTDHYRHLEQWPAESLIDALNAIIGA